MQKWELNHSPKRGPEQRVVKILIRGKGATVSVLCLFVVLVALSGCGGGGSAGISSQVVSGVASVGDPLTGQVTIKDASPAAQSKTTVIGGDGSYALDVTGMKAPFVLEAAGIGKGGSYQMYSFASGPGTANINPLSSAVVASAAGVDNPAQVYQNPDPGTLAKVNSDLPKAVADILAKLKPLLTMYAADGQNPITSPFKTDHTGLDGLLDSVDIAITNGILTITNAVTGAVIFTAKVTDINAGQLTNNPADFPSPPALPAGPALASAAPAAPGGVIALGGANQVTISWTAVPGATSYNIYWSNASGVKSAMGMVTTMLKAKIAGVTNPYVHTGLFADTAYYYTVTAVNGTGESAASSEVVALTDVPALALPAAPPVVMAMGGAKQVAISWNPVPGATSYNLYWATKPGVTTANGYRVAGITGTYYVQSALAAGITYYYILTAANDVGESASSTQAVAITNATPAAGVSYSATIQPLLNASCTLCHGTVVAAAGISLNSYGGIMQTVVAGNAAGSLLYTSVQGGTMPIGVTLSIADIQAIADWINQGALFN